MKKIMIFGTGGYYQNIKGEINGGEIIAFIDNNLQKVGEIVDGVKVISPKDINKYTFDEILIASQCKIEIANQLVKLGVENEKIKVEIDNKIYTKIESSGAILYDIDGLKIRAKSMCDIVTMHEIFKKNVYGFQSDNVKSVVIDIGMNVANASLYFARNENVEKVYGFEPFKKTYDQALENINLNEKAIVDKISTYNIALGNVNETKCVNYNSDFSGGNSILGDNNDYAGDEINIRKASEVLKPILIENKDKYIVFKIDCEGSEYSIFESLEEAGLTSKIDLILMEWHKCTDGNYNTLKKYLQSKKFIVILNTNDNYSSLVEERHIGMLYAFRRNII